MAALPGIEQCGYFHRLTALNILNHTQQWTSIIYRGKLQRSVDNVMGFKLYVHSRGKRVLGILTCPVIMHADTNFPQGRTLCAWLSSPAPLVLWQRRGGTAYTHTHTHTQGERVLPSRHISVRTQENFITVKQMCPQQHISLSRRYLDSIKLYRNRQCCLVHQ